MTAASWSKVARRDSDRAIANYEPPNSAFAERLAHAAVNAADFLAERPHAGPVFAASTRKWRVTGFDYILVHRITRRGVQVVRMRHVRENWRSAKLD
jgi:toxin ParE1/3/4